MFADPPVDGLAKKMLPVYVKEVEAYTLVVESAQKKPLEVKKEPIFEWLNPARGDTQGALILWLRDGRPAAVAGIFSYPHDKLAGRVIAHELHTLDAGKLVVKRDEYNQWKPQAGLARAVLPEAAAPATTAGARLVQMRRLAQEFGGYEVDRDTKRWELRVFAQFLSDGLQLADHDVDGDGKLSLFDLYVVVAKEIAQSYATAELLATEHQQLDDDGDGVGHECKTHTCPKTKAARLR